MRVLTTFLQAQNFEESGWFASLGANYINSLPAITSPAQVQLKTYSVGRFFFKVS